MLCEYKKFCASYFSNYGEYPSKEEILKGMQIDSSKLDLLERLSRESNAISLDTTLPGVEDCTVADVIANVKYTPFRYATGTLQTDTSFLDADDLGDQDAHIGIFVLLLCSEAILVLGNRFPAAGALISCLNAIVMYIMHSQIASNFAKFSDYGVSSYHKTGAYYIYILLSIGIALFLLDKRFHIFKILKEILRNVCASSGNKT